MTPAPFIVGVGRSGTTLLRLMLDAHPQLAIPSETHFLEAVIRRERQASLTPVELRDLMIGAPTWANLATDAASLDAVLQALVPFSTSDGVRAFYKLYARKSMKTRWGDKTPPYRALMPEIANLLPEAHFIHVIRDGRDVALSYRGLWFGPGDDVARAARFWRDEVEAARRAGRLLPHYLEVRYEDLITRPDDTLETVCMYLDLSFDARMSRYYLRAPSRLAEIKVPFGPAGRESVDLETFLAIHGRTSSPPDASRIGRWRTEMPIADQVQFLSVAGTLLRELGYDDRLVHVTPEP
jgi:hypothetical protein